MENTVQWKPVPEFDYEVSSDGRLRRIRTFGGRPTETYSSLHKKRTGYIDLWLWKDGKPTRRPAHRLVWEVFNGPIPKGLVINHKNGVKDDNRLENLEVLTQSENVIDGFRRGRPKPNNPSFGMNNGSAKLGPDAVREIRRLRKQGARQKDVAEKFGVSVPLVSLIHRRLIWVDLPD